MKRIISILLTLVIAISLIPFIPNEKVEANNVLKFGKVKSLNVKYDDNGEIVLSWVPIFTNKYFTSHKLTHEQVVNVESSNGSRSESLFGYEIWRKIKTKNALWEKIDTTSDTQYTDLCIAAKSETKIIYKIRAVCKIVDKNRKYVSTQRGKFSSQKSIKLKTDKTRFWISNLIVDINDDFTSRYIKDRYVTDYSNANDKKSKDKAWLINEYNETDKSKLSTGFQYHSKYYNNRIFHASYSLCNEKQYAQRLGHGEIVKYKNILYVQCKNTFTTYISAHIPLGDIYTNEYEEYLGVKETYYLQIDYDVSEYKAGIDYLISDEIDPISQKEVERLLDNISVKIISTNKEEACEELFDLYNLQYFKSWIDPYGKRYKDDFEFYFKCHFPLVYIEEEG